jgi:DNA-binding NtrC family response regulator
MERVMLFCSEDVLEPALLKQRCGSATKPGTRAQPEPIEDGDEGQEAAARIREALQRTGGNVTRASRLLELSRKALRYRLSRYRITPTASTDRRCRPLPSIAGSAPTPMKP